MQKRSLTKYPTTKNTNKNVKSFREDFAKRTEVVSRMLDLLSPPPQQPQRKQKIIYCKRCRTRDEHHTRLCPKAWHRKEDKEEEQPGDPPINCSDGKIEATNRPRDDDDSDDDLLGASPKTNQTSSTNFSSDLQSLMQI